MKLARLGLVVVALAIPATAGAGTDGTADGGPVASSAAVANRFVAAANRGDYATVCHLYSSHYLRTSQAACRSLYRWGASVYGRFDYRIVRRRRLGSGHRRIELTRWHHRSFIELARERPGWRIVAGGW
jgi:hypothetical protein